MQCPLCTWCFFLHCILCIIFYPLYSLHCKNLYWILCIKSSVLYSFLYNIFVALLIVYCIVCIVFCSFYSIYCILRIVFAIVLYYYSVHQNMLYLYALYSLHLYISFIIFIESFALRLLNVMHCIQCTVFYLFCTVYCIIYIYHGSLVKHGLVDKDKQFYTN